MANESPVTRRAFQLRGKIRISCGDSHFSLDFQEGRTLVEFPSFSRLLKIKSEVDSLRRSISRLPPSSGSGVGGKLPASSAIDLDLPEFRLTVRGRSVGKADFDGGGVRFHLTPFDFITKRMS